jgi:ATP-dependent exoDNAse (exonuclease V) beta subunit
VDTLIDTFQRILSEEDVAAVLQRAFYESPSDEPLRRALDVSGARSVTRLEVHNERRFAVRDENRLLSGVIDRLVLLYEGTRLVAADIIDYKTDAASRDDAQHLDQLTGFYRPQIAAYRRAVAKTCGLRGEQITARLLFVSPGVMRTDV